MNIFKRRTRSRPFTSVEEQEIVFGGGGRLEHDDRYLFHKWSLEEGPVLPKGYFWLEQLASLKDGTWSELFSRLSPDRAAQPYLPDNATLKQVLEGLKLPQVYDLVQYAQEGQENIHRGEEIQALINIWNLSVSMMVDFLDRINSDEKLQLLFNQTFKIFLTISQPLIETIGKAAPTGESTAEDTELHELYIGRDAREHRYYLQGKERRRQTEQTKPSVFGSAALQTLYQSTEWRNLIQSLRTLLQERISWSEIARGMPGAIRFYITLFTILRKIPASRGYQPIPTTAITTSPAWQGVEEPFQGDFERMAVSEERPIIYEKEEIIVTKRPTADELKQTRERNIDIALRDVRERVEETLHNVTEATGRREVPARSFPTSSYMPGGGSSQFSINQPIADQGRGGGVSVRIGRGAEEWEPMGSKQQPSIEKTVDEEPELRHVYEEESTSTNTDLITDDLLRLFESIEPSSKPYILNTIQFLMDFLYFIDRSAMATRAGEPLILPPLLMEPFETFLSIIESIIQYPMKYVKNAFMDVLMAFKEAHWDWKDYVFDQLRFLRDSISESRPEFSESQTANRTTTRRESSTEVPVPTSAGPEVAATDAGGQAEKKSSRRQNYLGSKEWHERATSLQTRLQDLQLTQLKEKVVNLMNELSAILTDFLNAEFVQDWTTEWIEELRDIAQVFFDRKERHEISQLLREGNLRDPEQLFKLFRLLSQMFLIFPRVLLDLGRELPLLLIPYWLREMTDVPLPRLFVQGDHLSFYLDHLTMKPVTPVKDWNWRLVSLQDWHTKKTYPHSDFGEEGSKVRDTASRSHLFGVRGHDDWVRYRHYYHQRYRQRKMAEQQAFTESTASMRSLHTRPWFSGLKAPRRKVGMQYGQTREDYTKSQELPRTSAGMNEEDYETIGDNLFKKPERFLSRTSLATEGESRGSKSRLSATTTSGRRVDQRYLLSCSGMAFELRDVQFGYLLKSKWLLGFSHSEMMDEGLLDLFLGPSPKLNYSRTRDEYSRTSSSWDPSVIGRHSIIQQRSPGVSFFIEVGSPTSASMFRKRTGSTSTGGTSMDSTTSLSGSQANKSLLELYGIRVLIDHLDIHLHEHYYSPMLYKLFLPFLKRQLKTQMEQSIEDYISLIILATNQYLSLITRFFVPS